MRKITVMLLGASVIISAIGHFIHKLHELLKLYQIFGE